MKGGGTPVNRQWVLVLRSGQVVIDWGDDLFQDVHEGDFLQCKEEDISHGVLDDELEILIRAGRVGHYDSKEIFFFKLPERHQNTIE